MLDEGAIADFERDGFLRLDNAFDAELAAACRSIIWQKAGVDPTDPGSWPGPVVRLGHLTDEVLVQAANTDVLHAAYDALAGEGNWLMPRAVGTFVLRLPSEQEPPDIGWHVDMSLGFDDPDFMQWRINFASVGRMLLVLMLFTDTGPEDGPTRLRVGSHKDIARQIEPLGERGATLGELARDGFAGSAHRDEALATGPAGTVYLCHPFLVHSAQPNRTGRPRILAQPPLLPAQTLAHSAPVPGSPISRAIR